MQPKTDLDPTKATESAAPIMPEAPGAEEAAAPLSEGASPSPKAEQETPAPKSEKKDDKKDSKLQGIEVLMNSIDEDLEGMEGKSQKSPTKSLEGAEPPGNTSKQDPLSMMKENGSGFDDISKGLNGGGSESGLGQEAIQVVAENPELAAAAL